MKKAVEKMLREFEDWKKDNYRILDIKDLNINPEKKRKAYSIRKEAIENLYFIKEGNKLIISGGAIVWLYLQLVKEGHNKDSLEKLIKRKFYRQYLEEVKIKHRMSLLNLEIEDFDLDKVKEMLK